MLLHPFLKLLLFVWSIRVAIIQEHTTQQTKDFNYKNSQATVCPSPLVTLKTTEKNILPTHANLTLTLSQCEPTDLLVQNFDKFAVENESHTSGNTSLDAHELSTTTGFGFGYITYFVLEEIIVTQLMKKENIVAVLCGVFIILFLLRKQCCRRKKPRKSCLNQSQVEVENPDEVLLKLENATPVCELKEQSPNADLDERRTVCGEIMLSPVSSGQLCKVKSDLPNQHFHDTNIDVQEETVGNMEISKYFGRDEERKDIVTIKINRELTTNWFIRSINTPTFVLLVVFHVLSNYPATFAFVYLADTIWNTNTHLSFFDIIVKKQTVERRNLLQLFANSRRDKFRLDFFTFGIASAYNSSTRRITALPRLPAKKRSLYTRCYFSLRHSHKGKTGVKILSSLLSWLTREPSVSEGRYLHGNGLD